MQGSLPEGCFQSGAFDVIVSSHVLEHQRDPRLAINAMLEMLHSDGCLVIHVPNANSWQAVLLAGTWAGFDIPRHPVTFDSTSLERLLASCGLSVGIRKPCSVIEAAFCLATSLCPSLDPDLRPTSWLGRTPDRRRIQEPVLLPVVDRSASLGPVGIRERFKPRNLSRSPSHN